MKDLKEFIESYYKKDDIFFIGFKSREDNPEVEWYHKPFNTSTINYNSLKGQNYYKKDIYLSLNIFNDKNKGRFEHNVKETNKIFFDIDERGIETKDRIIKCFGEPTIFLQTSPEKFQLIYELDNYIDKYILKELTYNLTYFFNTDKTFDLARVFRAPFYINNKNGFKVKVLRKDNYFNISNFYEFLKKEKWEWLDISKKSKSTPKKKDNLKKSAAPNLNIENKKFNKNNKYYSTYQKQVENSNNDKSNADLSFVRFLLYRKMRFENAIKNLFECRKDLIEKHTNLDEYISRIEIKCQDILNK